MSDSRERSTIVTLAKTLEAQKNLDLLCSRKPLEVTELYTPNEMYGTAKILKDYAGLPRDRSLKVVVQHGPDMSDGTVWDVERDFTLPAVMVFSRNREQAYGTITRKKIIRSASPYLYALDMMKDQAPPERKGTLFFHSHSTETITVGADFERQADDLAALDERFQPVTVCVYWQDYLFGHHLPFAHRGLPVVSAGHIHDDAFIARLHHLLSCHEYAMSNVIGTFIQYSIASGCRFHFYGLHWRDEFAHPEEYWKKNPSRLSPEYVDQLKKKFHWDGAVTGEEQRTWADYYLGREWFLSPEKLRRELLWAEWLDGTGVRIRNPGFRSHWIIPPLARRTYRKLKRLLPGT